MDGFDIGFPAKRTQSDTGSYGAGVTTDPTTLPACFTDPAIYFKTARGTFNNTVLANPPGYISTVITNTDRINLVTLKGSGVLTHVITPAVVDAGCIPTITITVDGKAYIFTTTVDTNGYRFVIGVTSQWVVMGTIVTATTQYLQGIGGYDDQGMLANKGKHTQMTTVALPSLWQVINGALPRLLFKSSLSVDMQLSINTNAAGALRQTAYVGYVLN